MYEEIGFLGFYANLPSFLLFVGCVCAVRFIWFKFHHPIPQNLQYVRVILCIDAHTTAFVIGLVSFLLIWMFIEQIYLQEMDKHINKTSSLIVASNGGFGIMLIHNTHRKGELAMPIDSLSITENFISGKLTLAHRPFENIFRIRLNEYHILYCVQCAYELATNCNNTTHNPLHVPCNQRKCRKI